MTRRPIPEPDDPDNVEQPFLKELLPPGTHIYKDRYDRAWRGSFDGRPKTTNKCYRAPMNEWEAGLFVVKAMWQQWVDEDCGEEADCPWIGML